MKSLGKAKFKSKEAFDSFIEFIRNKDNILEIRRMAEEVKACDRKLNPRGWNSKNDIDNLVESFDWMTKSFEKIHTKEYVELVTKLNDYVELIGSHFTYLKYEHMENVYLLQYGTQKFFVPDMAEYMDIEPEVDYSEVTLAELRNKVLSSGNEESSVGLMIPQQNIAINDVKAFEDEAKSNIDKIKEEMAFIEEARAGELAKMQAEIKKMEEEIEAKKNALEKQKEVMLAELDEKMAVAKRELEKFQIQIQKMEGVIYSIRCYMGETIELYQIRSGKNANQKNNPLVINQKMKYLDEELAKLTSVYDVDDENYKILEEMLKYNETAFEYFCPQQKCISCFRVSRDNKNLGFKMDKTGSVIIKEFDYYHGTRIGFLIRNGENLYVAYTDEKNVHISSEDVFMTYGYAEGDDTEKAKQTSVHEATSRYYILTMIQGIIDNNVILDLPKGTSIYSNTEYIVYSHADNWIAEKKFGDFNILLDKLSTYSKVGDTIVLLTGLSEVAKPWERNSTPTRGREDAYRNRTYDCKVKDGINTVNLIDKEGNFYVSAVKEDSYKGATSNFKIHTDEFFNVTYLNTEFLRYYITNKNFKPRITGREVPYAYFMKYLKIAMDYLKQREDKERELIEQYYPDLMNIRDWMVLLSYWKFMHKVREITDFQAKRFAKMLKLGMVVIPDNFFEPRKYFVNEVANLPIVSFEYERYTRKQREDRIGDNDKTVYVFKDDTEEMINGHIPYMKGIVEQARAKLIEGANEVGLDLAKTFKQMMDNYYREWKNGTYYTTSQARLLYRVMEADMKDDFSYKSFEEDEVFKSINDVTLFVTILKTEEEFMADKEKFELAKANNPKKSDDDDDEEYFNESRYDSHNNYDYINGRSLHRKEKAVSTTAIMYYKHLLKYFSEAYDIVNEKRLDMYDSQGKETVIMEFFINQ